MAIPKKISITVVVNGQPNVIDVPRRRCPGHNHP